MNRKILIFIGSILYVFALVWMFTAFLGQHEIRVDQLNWSWDDPTFAWLPVADVSICIFLITYGSVVFYTLLNWQRKYAFSRAMIAYGTLLLFRMLTMTILPLKEPESIVFLDDPFLNYFIYQGRMNADLFFSGHTGLLFLFYFLSDRKWIYLILGVILGTLLVVQRVHYSIDILGAIPFAWGAVKLTDLILLKLVRRT